MSRNKLYFILLIACIVGHCWLYFNIFNKPIEKVNVCLFKKITTIPCPSCGSTRAAISIIKGNFLEGFYLNPIGGLLVIILAIVPFWLLYDLLIKGNTLYIFYYKMEALLKKKKFAIPAIVLVFANWFWNIYKNL